MQDFTLHTHNGEQHFDGRADADTMISAAEKLGFKTIGVTNHFIVHENMPYDNATHPMFFNNFNQALEVMKRHIEIIEDLKSKHKINIKIGFETDFFQDKNWRINFEKMLPELKVDYLIGASHFLKSKDERFLCNIYHMTELEHPLTNEELDEYVTNHYDNIAQAARAGYFSFIAHLDYCTIFNIGTAPKFDACKRNIIEALTETKTPFEINTSGFDRIGIPHPAPWIIKELVKDGRVPVLLSDDAHQPDHLGRHFDKAEALLKEYGCTNRFTLNMLKKPL